jgi:hypothetical protein
MDTPLDDRDAYPWMEDEDAEAYKQEREDERLEEYLHPSEGNVY